MAASNDNDDNDNGDDDDENPLPPEDDDPSSLTASSSVDVVPSAAIKPTNLPLNVIIVTDTDLAAATIPNRTKKFYESDDTFIQTIFSQTITSTTVTPTDDDCSTYSFQHAVDEEARSGADHQSAHHHQLSAGSSSISINEDDDDIDLVEEADVRNTNLQPVAAMTPTNDLSQHTDIMDGYGETMISFTDVLGLDRDPDDHGGGRGGGDEEREVELELDGEVDGSVSYFDRTIVDEDEDVEDEELLLEADQSHELMAITDEVDQEVDDVDEVEECSIGVSTVSLTRIVTNIPFGEFVFMVVVFVSVFFAPSNRL